VKIHVPEYLAKWRRIWALTRKETLQILRDPSSIAIGGVVPVIMILLFGYGMSLDVTRVSVAVIDQDRSSDSAALVGASRLSLYFELQPARSMAQVTQLVLDRKVDGVLQIPSDFSRRWHDGAAEIQILVDGTDATRRASCKATPRDPQHCGAQRNPEPPSQPAR
jgi:ABC-2 type transport system permease protein